MWYGAHREGSSSRLCVSSHLPIAAGLYYLRNQISLVIDPLGVLPVHRGPLVQGVTY